MGCSKHEPYSTRNMLYSQKSEIGFPRSTFFTSYFIDGRVSLRKQPFLRPSSPLETFREEERLRLSDRNSILMT